MQDRETRARSRAARERAIRVARARRGACTLCGEMLPKQSAFKTCASCRAADKKRKARTGHWYSHEQRAKEYVDAKVRGLCPSCGAVADGETVQCAGCAEQAAARKKAMRHARIAAGKCSTCGKRKARPERRTCAPCGRRAAEYASKKYYALKARGERRAA